eukprot:CAMPEP_0204120472 /NCGR_PEP_ID=MMETSP0361-20130328/7675_1 /ASSEMBLY_ACC=CAM_ASM_000343 /TAXON_ID=268821 /ORGANISM="Scrippsiella Hangoei, Strain SHTV-5" /LENGTH=585 /DNA_ID=CAMNT_0051071695 /DNA_START=13 /DNA_END=1770 /DNA_ORIENTATION=+
MPLGHHGDTEKRDSDENVMEDARALMEGLEVALEGRLAIVREQLLCDVRKEGQTLCTLLEQACFVRRQSQSLSRGGPHEVVTSSTCDKQDLAVVVVEHVRDISLAASPSLQHSTSFDYSHVEEREEETKETSESSHVEGPRVETKETTESHMTGARLSSYSSREPARASNNKMLAGVRTWQFESVCSTFILLNCITMGIQSHQEAAGAFGPGVDTFLFVSEHVFTAFFLAEMILRLYAYGWRIYLPTSSEGRSNLLDALLVIFIGVLITWIIPFIALAIGKEINRGALHNFNLLRTVRLARSVRVFREVPAFREAWRLIRGLADSSRTLFWTCTVIFFVTYAFAVLGIAVIVEPMKSIRADLTNSADNQRIDETLVILDGLDKFMFTLIQVLCQDSFHAFLREIVHFLPCSWMFFYAYIAIASIVLMNLVTAIVVENAMEQSNLDHERLDAENLTREKREMKYLKKMFIALDQDGSGTLSWNEFRQSFADEHMRKRWRLLDVQPHDCKELFNLLDDGDGEIETSEFFDGLCRMKGVAQAKDVFRLQKTLNKFIDSANGPPWTRASTSIDSLGMSELELGASFTNT